MKPTMDELERRGYAMSAPAGRGSAFGELSEKDLQSFPKYLVFHRPLVRAAKGVQQHHYLNILPIQGHLKSCVFHPLGEQGTLPLILGSIP